MLRLGKQRVGPFITQHGKGRKHGFGCTYLAEGERSFCAKILAERGFCVKILADY